MDKRRYRIGWGASFVLGWFGVAVSTSSTLDEDRQRSAWQADMKRMRALDPGYGYGLLTAPQR